jgi:hypothetical protein
LVSKNSADRAIAAAESTAAAAMREDDEPCRAPGHAHRRHVARIEGITIDSPAAALCIFSS